MAAAKTPSQLTSLLRYLRPTLHSLSSPPLPAPLPQNILRSRSLRLADRSRLLHTTGPIAASKRSFKTTAAEDSFPADPSIPVPPDPPHFDSRRNDYKGIPEYQIFFTCRPCGHRSGHRITKQGYHHGTVLIQCPECKNRHVMSDHFKIFSDLDVTIEDILKERGEEVARGSLTDEGGSVEWFQGDGVRVLRRPVFVPKPRVKSEPQQNEDGKEKT